MRDTANQVVTIPVVWTSDVDSVASVDLNGVLTAGDTGVAIVTASALGLKSTPIGIHVVWQGPAAVAAVGFVAPNAVTPGATLLDSLKVVVTNLGGGPVAGALVSFAATAGGGSVSPRIVKTGSNGRAETQWTFGSDAGKNTVTATVVGADSTTAIAWVAGNPVAFDVTTFAALTVVRGDGQTGQILAPLPVAPAVKLVDAAGQPRAGVPVTFTATANSRVTSQGASTDNAGVASPGTWTLGDTPGDNQLIVTVENARLVLHATATGTPVRFMAVTAAAGPSATCALTTDQLVSCFGAAQLTGHNDSVSRSSPVRTTGDVHFQTLTGGPSHYCGVATDFAIYCWGVNALADTTGATVDARVPTKLGSSVAWQQVAAGGQHNCALANDATAYCWGANGNMQLGDNTTTTRFKPRAVAGGFQFTSLAAGVAHTCALTAAHQVFCWGANSVGQLGDGTGIDRGTPTVVAGSDKFIAVAAGGNWTCALTDAGQADCWGSGTGRSAPQGYADAPAFASISVGAAHACALTSDGTAYCWGDNSFGQLGDGTQTSRQSPVAVSTSLHFSSISTGTLHTCGVALDGSVACWGRNQYGEIGIDPPSTQLTPRFVVVGVQP